MPINPKPTYVANWNVTYQRQIFDNWMVSLSYLGNKTTHLWGGGGEMNPSDYIPGNCAKGQYGLTAAGPCSSTAQLNINARRLLYQTNPAFGSPYGSINTMDDGAVAHYNGALMSIQHRFVNNFTFLANYTLSNVSDADFGAALAASANSQPFNRHADWGRCVFDTRHNFNTTLVATSDFKHGNAVVHQLLSGWELAPLVHASSGQPLNITVGKDNSLTALNNDRANQVLPNVYAAVQNCVSASSPFCVQFLNPSAFASNPLGTFGNLARNAFSGPSTVNVDVAVSRLFKIRESMNLQARLDAFNVFNHPNFTGAISPAGTVASFCNLYELGSYSDFRARAISLRSTHSASFAEAEFLTWQTALFKRRRFVAGIRREILKPGVTVEEGEFHFPGRAVALLGEN